MHYTLKDHQGGLTATIHGNAVERLSYDAWGRRRNPNGFGYNNVTPTFDRGFTLHEHYDDFNLINMNGRCYDPVTSSFLSVDRFVQSPDNSQGFNRYAYCMYNPLRYIDPSGWALREPGNSPDDPPRLNNYRPGTYYSADPEYAWLVRLNEVEVSATSLGHDINNKGTNYTEGTQWSNNEQYTYLGATHNTGPVLESGGFGGGTIITTPNNQWGNSKLTPSVVNYVATGAGTITGYQKSLWEKPKSRAQKAINQKKAYETQKALKAKGITKSVKEIKAGKIANLTKASNALGIVGLGISMLDPVINNEIRPSNVYEIGTSATCLALGVFVVGSPVGWIAGGVFLGAEVISYAFTGQSIGTHLDQNINWRSKVY